MKKIRKFARKSYAVAVNLDAGILTADLELRRRQSARGVQYRKDATENAIDTVRRLHKEE
jgi:hypothetical protein